MKDLAQVRFSVPTEAAEAVANLLTEESGGVEQRDAETTSELSAGAVELVVWVQTAHVPTRVKQVETLLSSLKELGTKVDPWAWTESEADPASWEEAYKRYFKAMRIGRYFVVKPSWEPYTAEAADLVIEIDPGMAFGTGLHASTKLAIHMLERVAHHYPAPRAVLDLGCGTGILSIAAGKLWPATRVLAVDNDPTAVAICKENVARNGLEGRILVEQCSALDVRGTFSLVVANISAEVLTELQPYAHHYLDAFGHLILSGLTTEQARPLARLYCRELVLEPEFSEELDGWRALLLEVRD